MQEKVFNIKGKSYFEATKQSCHWFSKLVLFFIPTQVETDIDLKNNRVTEVYYKWLWGKLVLVNVKHYQFEVKQNWSIRSFNIDNINIGDSR